MLQLWDPQHSVVLVKLLITSSLKPQAKSRLMLQAALVRAAVLLHISWNIERSEMCTAFGQISSNII